MEAGAGSFVEAGATDADEEVRAVFDEEARRRFLRVGAAGGFGSGSGSGSSTRAVVGCVGV
ncbi:MAG TPA: hypothetical protein VM513_18680, partial [Kofleriaceae bacterium]|nr:hypothetical protein [Kofleriaceae bacterium]